MFISFHSSHSNYQVWSALLCSGYINHKYVPCIIWTMAGPPGPPPDPESWRAPPLRHPSQSRRDEDDAPSPLSSAINGGGAARTATISSSWSSSVISVHLQCSQATNRLHQQRTELACIWLHRIPTTTQTKERLLTIYSMLVAYIGGEGPACQWHAYSPFCGYMEL